MARAIRWQVKFADINKKKYKINIYDEGWSGAITQLLGGECPFETMENTDDDFFAPVITSTGTLRIVNQNNLNGLMPTSAQQRYVTLTDSSNVIHWQGYIQPDTFSQVWGALPQEVEFPLCSPISILKGKELNQDNNLWGNYGGTSTCSFAQLLWEMLQAMDANYNKFVFPVIYDSTMQLLDHRVSRTIWLSENTNEDDGSGDWNMWESKSLYEVLEDIASYFGWQVHEYRDAIYFGAVDTNSAYMEISKQDLEELANGRDAQTQTHSQHYMDIYDYTPVTNQHSESILIGKRKIKVKADFSRTDDVIPTLDFEKQKRDGIDTTVPYAQRLVYPTQWIGVRQYAPITSVNDYQCIYDNIEGIDNDCDRGGYPEHSSIIRSSSITWGETYGGCLVYEQTWTSDSVPHRLELKPRLYVKGMDMEMLCLRLFSHSYLVVPKGCLCISASVNRRGSTSSNSGHFMMRLKFGKKYYNGSSWQNADTKFQVNWSGGNINDTNTKDSGYPDVKGYIVNIDSSMCGDLRCEIFNDPNEYYPIYLEDFKIEYGRWAYDPLDYPDRDKNTYTKLLTKGYAEDYDKELHIAMWDGNSMGKGFLLSPTDTIISRVTIDDDDVMPEKLLHNRIVSWYNRTIKKLEIDVMYNENTTEPINKLYDGQSSDYAITAVYIDYRNAKQRLTLMQLY